MCFKSNFLKIRKFLKKTFLPEFVTGKFTALNYRSFLRFPLSGQVFSEPVAQRCSVKEVFLEILQNSQESTCARVSLF